MAEYNKRPRYDSNDVVDAFERILRDPMLNLELGPYLVQTIIPGKVEQGEFTRRQAEYIFRVDKETLDAMSTPEERAEAAREAEAYVKSNRVSDFSRP